MFDFFLKKKKCILRIDCRYSLSSDVKRLRLYKKTEVTISRLKTKFLQLIRICTFSYTLKISKVSLYVIYIYIYIRVVQTMLLCKVAKNDLTSIFDME